MARMVKQILQPEEFDVWLVVQMEVWKPAATDNRSGILVGLHQE